MPGGAGADSVTVTARAADGFLSDSQRQATFADIPIAATELDWNGSVWTKSYDYELAELIPDQAEAWKVKDEGAQNPADRYEQVLVNGAAVTYQNRATAANKAALDAIGAGNIHWVHQGIHYTQDVHTVHITATDEGSGRISTTVSYDNLPAGSAVPVFKNVYTASSKSWAHVIKHIEGRNFTAADQFSFTITNVGGSIMRPSGGTQDEIEEGTVTHTTQPMQLGSYGQKLDDASMAILTGEGLFYLDDLNSQGYGSFVYLVREPETAIWKNGDATVNVGKSEDLSYDGTDIYLKFFVEDNHDGTLNVESRYYTDPACTESSRLKVQNAPSGVLTDANGVPQVRVYRENGEVVPADAAYDEATMTTVDAAYFVNSKAAFTIEKKWEAVHEGGVQKSTTTLAQAPLASTVQLWRSSEARDREDLNAEWELVDEYTIPAGATGDDLKKTYPDLPAVDEAGKRYIYRVVEPGIDSSTDPVYSQVSYANEQAQDDGSITTNITVTNTYRASGTQSAAVVKELVGRAWLDTDSFDFTLTPVAKGYFDGAALKKDTSADAVASVPTPGKTRGAISTATATIDTTQVSSDEHLGLFGGALGGVYVDASDLAFNPTTKHLEGNFYYELTENIPDDATAKSAFSVTVDGQSVDVAEGARWDSLDADAQAAYIASVNPGVNTAWSLHQTQFEKDGITYTGKKSQVHVRARDTGSGELIMSVTYDEDAFGVGTAFTPVFTNTYSATGTATATVSKKLEGRAWNDDDAFTFTLRGVGDAPMPEGTTELTATMANKGGTAEGATVSVDFTQPLSFTLGELQNASGSADLASRSFVYELVEEPVAEGADEPVENLSYDTTPRFAKVTVADKGNGKLETSVRYFEDAECTQPSAEGTANPAPFVNSLQTTLKVRKQWNGVATSDVRLQLVQATDPSADEGDPAAAAWSEVEGATVDITRQEAVNGTVKEFANLPLRDGDGNTIRYAVKETTTASGNLAFEPSYELTGTGENQVLVVTNTSQYTAEGATQVSVVKDLQGRAWKPNTDVFTFTLKPIGRGYTNGDGELAVGTDKKGMDEHSVDVSTASQPVNEGSQFMGQVTGIAFDQGMLAADPADGYWKGDFFYELSEDRTGVDAEGKKQGIAYSPDTHTVHIHVEDDLSGTLSAKVSYDDVDENGLVTGSDNSAYVPVFTNNYDAVGNTQLNVTKHISGTGRTWQADDKFTIRVARLNNQAPLPKGDGITVNEGENYATLTISASGADLGTDNDQTAAFPLSFGLADLNGSQTNTFVYSILEVPADEAGTPDTDLVFDSRAYYARIVISDAAQNGSLNPQVTYYSDRECRVPVTVEEDGRAVNVPSVTFTNVVSGAVDVKAEKTWNHGTNPTEEYPESITLRLQRTTEQADYESWRTGATDADSWENAPQSATDSSPVTATVDAANATVSGDTWTYTFAGVPQYDSDGNKYYYRVLEDDVPGYRTDYTGVSESTEGSGTAATTTFTASVSNTYTAYTMPADKLQVVKLISGKAAGSAEERGWQAGDAFAFALTPVSNTTDVANPMPKDSTTMGSVEMKRTDVRDGDEAAYAGDTFGYTSPTKGETTGVTTQIQAGQSYHLSTFGSIKFVKPGTYYYQVNELTPADSGLAQIPGMSYTAERYLVSVEVVEKENGSLDLGEGGISIHAIEDNETGQASEESVGAAVFTNDFDATRVEHQVTATKSYNDYSVKGNTSPQNGAFTFTLRPVGDNADKAPMPDADSEKYTNATGIGLIGEGSDRVYFTKNAATLVSFEKRQGMVFNATALGITEAGEASGETFTYEIAEQVPDGAIYLGDGYWREDSSAIVYDGVVHVRSIKVWLDADGVLNLSEDTSAPDYYSDPAVGTLYRNRGDATATYAGVDRQTPTGGALFLNTRQPATKVSATKVWSDGDDQDGMRPRNITISLMANGQALPADAKTVYGEPLRSDWLVAGDADANNLRKDWLDLPAYTASGDEISYTVAETRYQCTDENGDLVTKTVDADNSLADIGYTSTVTGSQGSGYIVTNYHEPLKSALQVTHYWVDNDDALGKRREVTLHLYKIDPNDPEGKRLIQVNVDPRTVSADNGASTTWTDLPIYERVAVSGGSGGQQGTQSARMNLNTLVTQATLLANGDDARLSTQADDTSYVSQKIQYVVREEPVLFYTNLGYTYSGPLNALQRVELEANATAQVEVSDKIEVEPTTVEVTVKKVWDDSANRDGKRPESVRMQLFQVKQVTDEDTGETELVETAVEDRSIDVPSTSTDSASFGSSFVIDSDTTYVVREVGYTDAEGYHAFEAESADAVPGYSAPVSSVTYRLGGGEDNATVTALDYEIQNARTAFDTTGIAVVKKWEGDEDALDHRPDHVVVRLWASTNGGASYADTGLTARFTEEDADADDSTVWRTQEGDGITFADLDKYVEGKSGVEILYKVTEDWSPALVLGHYAPTVGSPAEITGGVEYTVTNTWNGSDDSGSTDPGTDPDNPDVNETVDVHAEKVWVDDDNSEGHRTQATLRLYKKIGDSDEMLVDDSARTIASTATGDDLKVSWTGLPEWQYGQKVTYRVGEDAVEGYSSSITSTTEDDGRTINFTVTNTLLNLDARVMTVRATKVWEVPTGTDESKLPAVTVHLEGKDGSGVIRYKFNATASAGSGWVAVWDNVPAKYQGDVLSYSVTEDSVDGFYLKRVEGNTEDGFVLTNAPVQLTGTVTAEKEWLDAQDQDGKRGGLGVRLVLQRSVKDADGSWGAWSDVKASDIEGATLTVANNGSTSGETKTLAGSYAFEGSRNIDKVKVTWDNLPTTAEVEDTGALSGQSADDDADDAASSGDGADTVTAEGGAATAPQAAAGDSPRSDVAPAASAADEPSDEPATADEPEAAGEPAGEADASAELSGQQGATSATASLTALFHLPRARDFVLLPMADERDGLQTQATRTADVRYRVVERDASGKDASAADSAIARAGYESIVTQVRSGDFEAKNVHTPNLVNITAHKAWSDAGAATGTRPDSVNFELLANGQKVRDALSLSAPEWAVTWRELPQYENGEEITYQVQEKTSDLPDGYTASNDGLAGADEGYTVTNTYNGTDETKDIVATKVWLDSDGNVITPGGDVHTPEAKLTLEKTVNGTTSAVEGSEQLIEMDATGAGLTVEWSDLAWYEAGDEVSYSVREGKVEGYTTSYSDVVRNDEDGKWYVTVTNRAVAGGSPGDPSGPSGDKDALVKVTYVDHLNAEGSQLVYVVKVKRANITSTADMKGAAGTVFATPGYNTSGEAALVAQSADDGEEAADASAEGNLQAQAASLEPGTVPADPSHDGYTFTGWDLNEDQFGDYVLVARYSQNSPGAQVVVSYVDPLADGDAKLLKSEQVGVGSEGAVSEPAKPAHDGYTFEKWVRLTDKGGNVIWVAQYTANPTPQPAPKPGKTTTTTTVVTTTVNNPADPGSGPDSGVTGILAKTADPAAGTALPLLVVALLAALITLAARRNRANSPEEVAARPIKL